MHRPLIITNDVRRSLRFGGIEMVGPPGYAPGVSPSQAARITIFLRPEEMLKVFTPFARTRGSRYGEE